MLTRHAVTTTAYDRAPDLAHAAAWALIHTAQNEHPHRITLIDTDDTTATDEHLVATAGPTTGHRTPTGFARRPAHIPRLTPTRALTPPPTPAWRLATTGKGDLTNLALVARLLRPPRWAPDRSASRSGPPG